MEDFKIKSYSLTQLALLYQPHLSPKSALRTLKNWIDFNPELKEALLATGYHPAIIRTLTPRQVSIIVSYLGPP